MYQSYRCRGTGGELWHPGGSMQPNWFLNDGTGGDYSIQFDKDGWFSFPWPVEPGAGEWKLVAPRYLHSDLEESLRLLAEGDSDRLDAAPPR